MSRQGRKPVEVHLLSSTATSAAELLRKSMGNTGHRRKRSAESSAIADGVAKSADKMFRVLSDINETQRSTEKEKLEVHGKHFQQSLDYKKERDKLNFKNT